jgi:hypothetical protein
MKATTLLTITATLFSQVALADQPCGNYGISTNQPNNCAPQQQPVVYAQPQQAPVQQAPCGNSQVVYAQPAPQPAPVQTPAPSYGWRTRYNAGYQQQTVFGLRAQRAENTAPTYERGLEVGVRGSQDANTLLFGAGVYLRAHQKSGQQRLALEVSADTFETGALLTQAAAMLYLNPNGAIKPFGLVGGGLELGFGEAVAQAGVGLDIEVGRRLTITGDLRAVEAVNGASSNCFDNFCSSSSSSLVLGNLGIARRF